MGFAIAMIISAVVAAGSSYYAGQQQKKVAEKQAELQRIQAAQEAKNLEIQKQDLVKRQTGSYAAAGVEIDDEDEGSTVFAVKQEATTRYDEWIQNVLTTGGLAAEVYETQGDAAYNTGIFNAVGSLVQGAAGAYGAVSSGGGMTSMSGSGAFKSNVGYFGNTGASSMTYQPGPR